MTADRQSFQWRPIYEKAFEEIKYLCSKTPVLKPIDPRKDDPIWVICDASTSGLGAMYGQGPTWDTCRPAGFMSKKFNTTTECLNRKHSRSLNPSSNGRINFKDIKSMW